MKLYAAFDLHSSNSYLGIVDENGKRTFKRILRNEPEMIRETLRAFNPDIVEIAVESTYIVGRFSDRGKIPCAFSQSLRYTAVFGTKEWR